jgi:hypothetical protein
MVKKPIFRTHFENSRHLETEQKKLGLKLEVVVHISLKKIERCAILDISFFTFHI